jgi:hypothetical protein
MAAQVRIGVKGGLLGTLAAMPERVQTASPSRDAGELDDRGALSEEVARQREEILRLRDLLIGKDAELGTLRGRVAELEAGVGRLLNLGARVRARVPSFVWSARAKLRGRRGSQD